MFKKKKWNGNSGAEIKIENKFFLVFVFQSSVYYCTLYFQDFSVYIGQDSTIKKKGERYTASNKKKKSPKHKINGSIQTVYDKRKH